MGLPISRSIIEAMGPDCGRSRTRRMARSPLVSTGRAGVVAPEHRAEPLAELVVMDLSGYKLEPLNQGGELILYRGVHASPADVLPPALVVAPAAEYASPATLARIEHEYSLAAELDPR